MSEPQAATSAVAAQPVGEPSIIATARQKIAAAYYDDEAMRSSPQAAPFIDLIIQLVMSLLGGCTAARAKEAVHRRPFLTRIRVAWAANTAANSSEEARRITETVMKVASESTEDEFKAFMAARTSVEN